ncbi:hypothetical protein LguiB_030600 [Lonicera macranthoides]
MSTHSITTTTTTFFLRLSPTLPSSSSPRPNQQQTLKLFTEYLDVFSKNIVPLTTWHEIVEDDTEEENLKASKLNKINELVDTVRSMLGSMDDGEISISPYDTAWVALVEDINGSGAPQFPSSLEWIANNQLPDGSWGDRYIFSAYERIINTLACVIALRTWNVHPQKGEKEENAEHMPIGFEVAFPSLLEIARKLGIEVFPEESPVLQEIYARRNVKLTRIPKDIMHRVPTTLLHSLEGMKDLEWEKLLQLQCKDGSFLFSPSSTAFALISTKDSKCLSYLSNAVLKFNGGVPNVYPVDLFEHIWVVDRLQRLGISRHFKSQIKDCMDYIHRYWRKEGICWARNSPVQDIDDTAMGFRLLRLHGYPVSADVFKNFKNGGEFFCFAGQSNQAITGMYNLLRASQMLLPGEGILEDAKQFSYKFLKEKQAANEILDKWIITKDLRGEVEYALNMPWYASLARVETRYYLEHYGGEDDVWIGKTLYRIRLFGRDRIEEVVVAVAVEENEIYLQIVPTAAEKEVHPVIRSPEEQDHRPRMPYVNNNTYMELAKLDYNNCQAMHLVEWSRIKQWYEHCNFGEYGESQESLLLLAYYLATANIYEPERSKERVAWAKTTTLMETIISYFGSKDMSSGQRKAFVHEFKNHSNNLHYGRRYKMGHELVGTLLETLYQLSFETLLAYGVDIQCYLAQAIRGVETINTQNGCIKDKKIESEMQELVELVICSTTDGLDADIKQTFLTVAKTFYYIAYCNPETIGLHISKVLFNRVL